MLGKVAWCSDWLGQWRIKQVFVNVICLWPAGGNLGGIHATVWYLTIYPFQLRWKWPTRVILENHGCKFTHSWETVVKLACVCVWSLWDSPPISVILSVGLNVTNSVNYGCISDGGVFEVGRHEAENGLDNVDKRTGLQQDIEGTRYWV
jgi:hypothetical protein